MSSQTDVVLPCIGSVLAEVLGSRVVLGSLGPLGLAFGGSSGS